MIRALFPVAFALVLAVAAGILLAQNGLFTDSDSALGGFLATWSGGSCCSKARAKDAPTSFATAEMGCCGQEASGERGGCCPSQAKLASLTSENEDEACSAGGCPFATASADSTCCSQGSECCSDNAKACSDEACDFGAKECGNIGPNCCSDSDECSSREENGETEPSDAVAALSD